MTENMFSFRQELTQTVEKKNVLNISNMHLNRY